MKEKYDKSKSYILYFLMYCPLGFVCPMVAQYCASIGFSGTQVGVVTSCGTLGAVLGGMFWGKIFANSNRKRYVVITMFLLAGAMAVGSTAVRAFAVFALFYGGIYFFQGPSHGLCDHMIIAKGGNFPAIRAMGAVGYAVACWISGMVAEKNGLTCIFFMHAAGYVLASLVMKTEEEPPHFSDRENRANIGELFGYPKFIKLLACSFLILGPVMATNTYFSYLYIEAGGDLSGVGFAFLLMAGSEAVFMFLIPYAERRISVEKLIVIGVAVAVARYGLYATGPSLGMLLGSFWLQGIMNGIILVEMVKYFGKIVEPRLSSVSVSTYYALGNNFSSIICNLLCGMALDRWGGAGAYAVMAVFSLAGLIAYVLLGLFREEGRKGNGQN